jgi:NADH dehydrogenase
MILVTGGNGFVGREIVSALLERGYEVRVLTRKAGSYRFGPFPAGVEVIEGDIQDEGILQSSMDGVNGVIHLVGIIAETKAGSFEDVHVGITQKVVAAAEAAGVARYLQMSATGTRPNAPSRYHQTKFQAEEVVRKSRLAWTILRPSLIFGPKDAFLNLFVSLMRLPTRIFPLIGDGTTILRPIAVEEVARCFVSALANPETIGQTYELVGEPITYQELVVETAKAAGLNPVVVQNSFPTAAVEIPLAILRGARPVIFPAPVLLFRIAAWHFEWLPLPFAAPVTNDQITMITEDQVADPTPMIRTFGFQPTPLTVGIRRYLGK